MACSPLSRHHGVELKRTEGWIPPRWINQGGASGSPGGETRLGVKDKKTSREETPTEGTQPERSMDPTI